MQAKAAFVVQDNQGRPLQGANDSTDVDLASFEGKYPGDLFNKSVIVPAVGGDTNYVGRVQMEGKDAIVVFSDTGKRFDIPKSDITISGGYVLLNNGIDVASYSADKDAPLPVARSLRPSAEEIRRAASEQEQIEIKRQEEQRQKTRADMVLRERAYLAAHPYPETTTVSQPANYVDDESEISKKAKSAASELRDLLYSGARVAKVRAKKAKRKSDAKKAEYDARMIGRMGGLAPRYAETFDEILAEIKTRSYAEQELIYSGFLKLMDYQRDLVVARRAMAARLKDAVPLPVASPDDMNKGKKTRRGITERKTPALPDISGETADKDVSRRTAEVP
jgi:hypothetical protein